MERKTPASSVNQKVSGGERKKGTKDAEKFQHKWFFFQLLTLTVRVSTGDINSFSKIHEMRRCLALILNYHRQDAPPLSFSVSIANQACMRGENTGKRELEKGEDPLFCVCVCLSLSSTHTHGESRPREASSQRKVPIGRGGEHFPFVHTHTHTM